MNPKLRHNRTLTNGGANGDYSLEKVNDVSQMLPRESLSPGDALLTAWRERRFIAKAFVFGLLASAIVSLLIPPKYEATTRLLPPEGKGLGALAMILAGGVGGDERGGASGSGAALGGMLSDVVGLKTSGALYIGVLRSRTLQDALINRFDLRQTYRQRYMKETREQLADNTDIIEDRKSGIITLNVMDRSPQRARELASAYVETMNELMAQVNTSSAHRERVFIEDRLKTVRQDLDAAAKDMSEFSSKNLTLDIKEQAKAMVQGAAGLQGELIAAESQLSGLEQIYTGNNIRVRSLRARVDDLKRQMASLEGVPRLGESGDQNASGGEFPITISKLPVLSVSYFDLYRRLRIQETVFEILNKQLELAKIEEAKELPTVKVLDEATVPERKASPKRTLITLIGAFLAAILAMSYIVGANRFRSLSVDHPLNLFALEMREGFADDMNLARSRLSEWLRWARGSPNGHHGPAAPLGGEVDDSQSNLQDPRSGRVDDQE